MQKYQDTNINAKFIRLMKNLALQKLTSNFFSKAPMMTENTVENFAKK